MTEDPRSLQLLPQKGQTTEVRATAAARPRKRSWVEQCDSLAVTEQQRDSMTASQSDSAPRECEDDPVLC